MTREETKGVLNIIFDFRPFYKNSFKESELSNLTNEWCKVLEPYELGDVKANLETFFLQETTRIPTPYDLIKELRTIEQKNRKGRTYIYCEVCHKPLEIFFDRDNLNVERREADMHMERCRSVRHLQLMYTKYLGREILEDEVKRLRNMDNSKFDDIYYKVLKKAYEQMPDTLEKQLTAKVLESVGML